MSDGKSNKLILILLIVLVILFLGAAVFFGYYFFIKQKGSSTAQFKKIEEKTVAVDEIIVNLADEDTKSYIKTKVYLGYTEKNIDKEISDNMPQIRNAINTCLRTKKSQDFNGQGLEKVRKEILDKVNEVLGGPKATNVYFYEIIIQ